MVAAGNRGLTVSGEVICIAMRIAGASQFGMIICAAYDHGQPPWLLLATVV
jgi:hypothetical protein